MTNTTISKTGASVPFIDSTKNNPSKCTTLGFAIALIVGIGGLIVAGVGGGGLFHVGALSSLGQVNSMLLVVIGGAGGIPCLTIGIVGFINLCNKAKAKTHEASLQKQSHSKGKEGKEIQRGERSQQQVGAIDGEQIAQTKELAGSDVQTEEHDTHAQTPVHRLPQDMLALIFHFLTLQELATVSSVCKRWQSISGSNAVWQRLFIPKFGLVDDPSKTFSYKSEYKKSHAGFFTQLSSFVLSQNAWEKIQGVTFGTDSVVTWNEENIVKIWISWEGKWQCLSILPSDANKYGTVQAAIENRTLVLRKGYLVQVFNIQKKTNFEVDKQPSFQYEHNGTSELHYVNIVGDLVVSAVGNNIQIWNYKTEKRLHEFNVVGTVNKVVIQNDIVACVVNEREVKLFSMKTGKHLRAISATQYANVYKDKIVCIDDNIASIYFLESGKYLGSFSYDLSFGKIKNIIVFNNLLITILDGYGPSINIYSAGDGTLLKQFHLENDWIGADIKIQGNDLIVCGRSLKLNTARSVKVWQIRPKK